MLSVPSSKNQVVFQQHTNIIFVIFIWNIHLDYYLNLKFKKPQQCLICWNLFPLTYRITNRFAIRIETLWWTIKLVLINNTILQVNNRSFFHGIPVANSKTSRVANLSKKYKNYHFYMVKFPIKKIQKKSGKIYVLPSY